MNQDVLTHVSRFLSPNDLQTMALVNHKNAAAIRYAYQGQAQREPIRTWNRIRKQFQINAIGTTKWINMDINQFPYLDHVTTLFDIVIENKIGNIVLHSENLAQPTEEQFHNFVHQLVTRNHSLETISMFYITVTNSMYTHILQSLRPILHSMNLKYVSCNEGRLLNRSTYS